MTVDHSFSVTELAKKINARVIGDEQAVVTGLASIASAKSGDLTFLLGDQYKCHLSKTKATAIILSEDHAADCSVISLIVKNPERCFAQIARLFDPFLKPSAGIHPSAIIADTANIHPSVAVGANCVIGENVSIAENTLLLPGSILNDRVAVGSDCMIHSHVTLCYGVRIGSRVILHSGAVIGADGFGLTQHNGSWDKIPQIGSVVIEDDVEIGANTCIDRGALDNTVIETGVKIDNLVQIAHNVVIGAHTVLAGCVTVAGSAKIGRHCVVGGKTDFAGHIEVCDGAIFSGRSMVTGSIKRPGIYSSGTGLLPNALWKRNLVRFKQLDTLFKRVKKLEDQSDE